MNFQTGSYSPLVFGAFSDVVAGGAISVHCNTTEISGKTCPKEAGARVQAGSNR